MRMSLRGLKETWHLFLCQFLKDCRALCHRSWLEVFQLKWGKCWFSCIRRFLWECDYSVKIVSESEAVYLPVAPVSQPSPPVAVSLGSCRLSPLSWTCSALLLLAVVQAGKLLGFVGKPEACLVRLQIAGPASFVRKGTEPLTAWTVCERRWSLASLLPCHHWCFRWIILKQILVLQIVTFLASVSIKN